MFFLSAFLDETGCPTLLMYFVIFGVILAVILIFFIVCLIKVINFYKLVKKEEDKVKEFYDNEKF